MDDTGLNDNFHTNPRAELIDEIFGSLTPYIEEDDGEFCFHIEDDEENWVSENCSFTSYESAENAADEKRFEIALHLAQHENR